MAVLEISVVPIGTQDPSVGKYVASAEEVLKNYPNVKSQITAMGTIIESDSVHELFEIAEKMHKRDFSVGAKRVFTHIALDERIDKESSIEGRVESVKQQMARQ